MTDILELSTDQKILEENETGKKQEKMVQTNPKDFLKSFRNSNTYKEAYESFYSGKTLAENVTEEEKIETFESGYSARQAIIDYTDKEDVELKYDPQFYSSKFQQDYNRYIHHIKDVRRGHWSRDRLTEMDNIRTTLHSTTSKDLMEMGITKSIKLARGMVQLMLIENKLEQYQNARISEETKMRWVLNSLE